MLKSPFIRSCAQIKQPLCSREAAAQHLESQFSSKRQGQGERSAEPKKIQVTKQAKGRSKGQRQRGGKSKTKNKRGRGPNVPEQLIGKAKETKDGRRLCWAFNLPDGCAKAPPEAAVIAEHICVQRWAARKPTACSSMHPHDCLCNKFHLRASRWHLSAINLSATSISLSTIYFV